MEIFCFGVLIQFKTGIVFFKNRKIIDVMTMVFENVKNWTRQIVMSVGFPKVTFDNLLQLRI